MPEMRNWLIFGLKGCGKKRWVQIVHRWLLLQRNRSTITLNIMPSRLYLRGRNQNFDKIRCKMRSRLFLPRKIRNKRWHGPMPRWILMRWGNRHTATSIPKLPTWHREVQSWTAMSVEQIMPEGYILHDDQAMPSGFCQYHGARWDRRLHQVQGCSDYKSTAKD